MSNMPPKRKVTTVDTLTEATPVKNTKGIMAVETTKYSEAESATEKQCTAIESDATGPVESSVNRFLSAVGTLKQMTHWAKDKSSTTI